MSTWQLLSSFPSAIPTVLLAVLLIYWCLSIIGIVDMGESMDFDVDAGHAAHDAPDLHSLASYVVALGLGGVPLSVAASVLVFFTWLFTALMHQYLVAWLPTDMLRLLAGIGVLLLAAALAIPISARILKPMRGLFVKHSARSNESLVGLDCKIVTQKVDQKFGRAEVDSHGASINIRVWAEAPNDLVKNSRAIIVAYDETTQQYEVQAAPVTI